MSLQISDAKDKAAEDIVRLIMDRKAGLLLDSNLTVLLELSSILKTGANLATLRAVRDRVERIPTNGN